MHICNLKGLGIGGPEMQCLGYDYSSRLAGSWSHEIVALQPSSVQIALAADAKAHGTASLRQGTCEEWCSCPPCSLSR